MNRRAYIRVLLWLLPLLFARAFIPTGFMLGEGQDGFGLVFCSGTMAMPGSNSPGSNSSGPHHQHPDHSAHAGHNHYEAKAGSGVDPGTAVDHSGHSHSHGDDSAACPFAIGACAAFIDVPHLASLPASSVDEQVQLDVVPTSGIATPRAHPIRGPPQSS